MKGVRFFVVLLAVVALLVSTVGPAQAATTYEVKVNNLTSQTFSMVFTGKGGIGNYTFTVKPGVNLVKLPAGKFTFRYTSCGKATSGDYTVATKENEKIMIKACPPGFDTGPATSTTSSTTYEVKINNQTGTEFKIVFTGASAYTFTIKPGVNIIKLPLGKFKYKYTACGDNTTGNYTVQKNNPKLEIKACKGAGTTSIQFENRTGGSMSITLIGPTTYRLTIPTGKSTVQVIKGTYTYSVWSICGSTGGTIKLTAAKFWDWWCH